MKHELTEEELKITEKHLKDFIEAKNYQEQLNILIAHSQQNQKRLIIRRNKKMEENQKQVEQEMVELNNQFSEFLHTKGIKAKFKLAFSNMKESAKKQHEQDVKNFNEVKAKSIEENKDFVEFLHAKGIKAKFHVVIENIKKGIKEAPQKTAQQIAKSKVNVPHTIKPIEKEEITADMLSKVLNEFLKMKGLENQFKVEIVED